MALAEKCLLAKDAIVGVMWSAVALLFEGVFWS